MKSRLSIRQLSPSENSGSATPSVADYHNYAGTEHELSGGARRITIIPRKVSFLSGRSG
ncbi:hypothetical protein [Pontibacter sp. BAB1700]|uniref:hypothetical protein n=1 Tax=Pontibacter sp. BAB1700 TaxID=1144253 RepID=UPI0003072FB7